MILLAKNLMNKRKSRLAAVIALVNPPPTKLKPRSIKKVSRLTTTIRLNKCRGRRSTPFTNVKIHRNQVPTSNFQTPYNTYAIRLT